MNSVFNALSWKAQRACKNRFHSMTPLSTLGRPKEPNVWLMRCRDCKKECRLILVPLPNETQISGEAVAMDCPCPGTFSNAYERNEKRLKKIKAAVRRGS